MKTKVSGISLLEVLITVLVMAIGMLGFAALQLKTINTAQESYSRSQAVAVLEDVTDRLRANAQFIHSDTTDSLVTYAASADSLNWCDTPPTGCAAGSICSGDELVKSDMAAACTNLASVSIPNAKIGAVCQPRALVAGEAAIPGDTCPSGSKFVIYASWEPQNREDTDGSDTFAQNTRCQTVFGLDSSESCVLLELVP